jgi:hypothetical protein
MSTRIDLKTQCESSLGSELTKTGQTVSYRTGDDGDIEAGRDVSFLVLPSNNPFGNTNRFTDELGGQSYANNIVIDWSTYDGTEVLGYYRTISPVDITWNVAIDSALALSVGSYTSGWRLPNKREIENVFNYGLSQCMNYAPFNIINTIWCSTTYTASTTLAYTATVSWINLSAKSGAGGRYIGVRNFTVTGTILT